VRGDASAPRELSGRRAVCVALDVVAHGTRERAERESGGDRDRGADGEVRTPPGGRAIPARPRARVRARGRSCAIEGAQVWTSGGRHGGRTGLQVRATMPSCWVVMGVGMQDG
jgi:hypothetical protein